jgi:hypothetical protein
MTVYLTRADWLRIIHCLRCYGGMEGNRVADDIARGLEDGNCIDTINDSEDEDEL